MATTSRIVAVRKAFVAAVDNLPEFADVDVMYAFKGTTSRDFAFTRNARFDHSTAGLRSGRRTRNEVGRFELVIRVEVVGGDCEDADDRALELGAAVEDWCADHKTGAAAGTYTFLVDGEGSLDEVVGDQAALAELIIPIRYDARLE